MGTEQAAITAATTANIQQALRDKNLTRNELASRAGIAKSTFYRNMQRPEKFTVCEIGQIAEALDLGLIQLLTPREPA